MLQQTGGIAYYIFLLVSYVMQPASHV